MKTKDSERGKYQPEILIAMFRKAAALRNEMLDAGFTDNGGAIHSSERILNILGLRLNYPELSHINNLRNSRGAEFSIDAWNLHRAGDKVLIEHVSPLRALTREAIAKIEKGATDGQLRTFVKRHYRLVLLSPDETQRLNRQNRSRMHTDRLGSAGIQLAASRMRSRL